MTDRVEEGLARLSAGDTSGALDTLALELKNCEEVTDSQERACQLIQVHFAICFAGMHGNDQIQVVRSSLKSISPLLEQADSPELRRLWHFRQVQAAALLGDEPVIDRVHEFVTYVSDYNDHSETLPLVSELIELLIDEEDRESCKVLEHLLQQTLAVSADALGKLSWSQSALLASQLRRLGDLDRCFILLEHVLSGQADSDSMAKAYLTKGILAAQEGRDFTNARSLMGKGLNTTKDPGLRELIRLNLLQTYADDGDGEGLENEAQDWLRDRKRDNEAGMSLSTVIAIARKLRNLDRTLTALQVLMVADRDLTAIPGPKHLEWLEEVVAGFQSLAADSTAIDFCRQAIALDDRLTADTRNFGLEDYERIARFYELLVTFYTTLDRFDDESTSRSVSFLEAMKEAEFASAFPLMRRSYLSKSLIDEHDELLTALIRLEQDTETRMQREPSSNTSSIRSEHAKEARVNEITSRLSEIRKKAKSDLSRFPSLLDVSPDSLLENFRMAKWPQKALGLAYRVNVNEMELAIYLLGASGVLLKHEIEINPAAIDAMLHVLMRSPDDELDYIVAQLSEFLLPLRVVEQLAGNCGATLLLSPDRSLAGVPWEALGRGELRLGTEFALCRSPSLTRTTKQVLDNPVKEVFIEEAFVVADPSGDLFSAAREGSRVSTWLRNRGPRVELSNC